MYVHVCVCVFPTSCIVFVIVRARELRKRNFGNPQIEKSTKEHTRKVWTDLDTITLALVADLSVEFFLTSRL